MPDWPALMTRETAAAYCDMTPEQFDRQCPVGAVDQGWRGYRWKRAKLDAWIEQLPEKAPRKCVLQPIAVDGPTPAAPDAAASAEERRRQSLARVTGGR